MSHTNASAKGAWGESLVCANLLERGYEVFRSISPGSPCDLIAMRGDLLLRVEVRCAYFQHGGYTCATPDSSRHDLLALVTGDTGKVYWYPPLDEDLIEIEFSAKTRFKVV